MRYNDMVFNNRVYRYIWAFLSVVLFTTDAAPAQEYQLELLNKGAFYAIASVLHDYDGDEDLDIIATRLGRGPNDPGGVEWLENDGTGQFVRHEIYRDENLVRTNDIDPCDCDNDGDIDYVISERGNNTVQGQLFWLQREDPETYIKWTIEAGTGFDQADVADFNGDGNLDIVAVGFSQTTVNVYLNDGEMNFEKQAVASDVTQADIVEADDIDGDGDVDIVFGGGDASIYWNDGEASFESGPSLFTWDEFSPSAARGFAVADVTNDGVKDILTFSGRGTGGLYLLDGSSNFDQTLIDRRGIDLGGDIVVADIDGNGLMDIIRQQMGDGFLIILYQDESMAFRDVILERKWDERGPSQMTVGDLDGDGDLDLVFPENGNVDGDLSWFENIDGKLYLHQLHMEFRGAHTPLIVDLDGDGDEDVILTVTEDISVEDEIVWFENRGDAGFVEWRIADSLDTPIDIHAADLDGDGNLDLVATARDDNDLLWFRRDGVDWEAFVIEDNAIEPLGITVADLDSDGDADVVLTSSEDAKVFWYKNNGSGEFTREVVDNNLPEPFEVEYADLDGDEDIDLVVTSTHTDNPVVVYLNDGSEGFTRQIVSMDVIPSDLEIGDWNADGSPDILVSTEQNTAADPDVLLLTNNGDGTFESAPLITDNRNVTAIRLAVIGDDGTQGLLVGNDNAVPRIRLYLNQEGEAVSSVDLLEDVTASIAGIDTGDLNGDGVMDFVASDNARHNLMLFLGQGTEPTAVEPISDEIPEAFSLGQNYPNPFNPITTITFDLAQPSHVVLKIYDIRGREVATLVSDTFQAGLYEVNWDATGFASGLYVYRLQTATHSEARILNLLK